MAKLLIIEDDSYIATELRNWLVKEKFIADISLTGDDGLYRLKHFDYDLAIVDWNLPDMEGIEICQLIRKEKEHMPLIMLTSRKDLSDRIEGLDSGAMDYMVKPCVLPELSARIRALLRRQPEIQQRKVLFLDLSLNPETRQSFCSDEEMKLTPTEFDILLLLANSRGKALDYRTLAEIPGKEHDEAARSKMKNYMSILRKKLQQANSIASIEHRFQEGYLLVEKNASDCEE